MSRRRKARYRPQRAGGAARRGARAAGRGGSPARGPVRPGPQARAGARRPEPRSGARRALVLLAALGMLAASVVGSGALGGTPIDEAADGAFAADATPLAPAGPAFAIWSVIYTGLIALALWQALPRQRTNDRLRRLDPLIGASFLLNGAWILSVQSGAIVASVVLIAVLLAVLAGIFVALVRSRPGGRAERLVLDGAMGLYLGWVAVATVANVTAWLVASGTGEILAGRAAAGTNGLTTGPTTWAVAVLVVVALVGVGLARFGRGRLAPAAAMCWGLAWIAVGRLTDQPESVAVGVAALAAAGAIAVAAVVERMARR